MRGAPGRARGGGGGGGASEPVSSVTPTRTETAMRLSDDVMTLTDKSDSRRRCHPGGHTGHSAPALTASPRLNRVMSESEPVDTVIN